MGQYVAVSLLPDDPKSSILHVITSPDMTQKAVVLAVGQGVHDLKVGSTVLCRPHQGDHIGDTLLLPQGAVIGTLDA